MQHISTHDRLDIFQGVAFQNSLGPGSKRTYRPIAALNAKAPIEFNITTAHDEVLFLDTSKFRIKVQLAFQKDDGSNLNAEDWKKVALINNSLHSLYENVTLSIGERHVTGALSNYAYTAYFKNMLECSESSKKGHLSSAGYIDADPSETPSEFHQKLFNPKNLDMTKGPYCELSGRLCLDLFEQHKAMIGGTDIRLKLFPSPPVLYVLASPQTLKGQILFDSAEFTVFIAKLSPMVDQAISQTLLQSPAKYHFLRHETFSSNIPQGHQSWSVDNVVRGQLPRKVFVAMVANSSMTGNWASNPFKFESFDVRSLALYRNNELINGAPYTPNFKQNQYLNEYDSLIDALNQNHFDAKFSLSRDRWLNNNTIFGFNLSEDLSEGNQCDGFCNFPKFGSLRLDLSFATATTQVISVLLFCVYDSNLYIDAARQATTDY